MFFDVISTMFSAIVQIQKNSIDKTPDENALVGSLEILQNFNQYLHTFVKINSYYEEYLAQSAGIFGIEKFNSYSVEKRLHQLKLYREWLRNLKDRVPVIEQISIRSNSSDFLAYGIPHIVLHEAEIAESLVSKLVAKQWRPDQVFNEIDNAIDSNDLSQARLLSIQNLYHDAEEIKYLSFKLIEILTYLQSWLLAELIKTSRVS